MAFQYTEFGRLIATDSKKAHDRLTRLFAKHECKVSAVAKDMGTSTVQLRRWIAKLVKLGYVDPGNGTRGVRGPGLAKTKP